MAIVSEKPLTLPQVAEAANVEYRTLHTWVKRGLLKPSFLASTGAGHPNLFSYQDALKARILGDFRGEGIDLDLIERAAEELQQWPILHPDDIVLVNGHVSVLKPTDNLNEAIKEAKPSVVYRVSWAVDALKEPDLK